jgi:periplasmic divalent cation tolerance protein
MSVTVVLTTVSASYDARSLARALVEAHLAACVNIVPAIHSVYRWNAAIEEDEEQLLVIKTTAACVDALREALLRLHPYEVPEFVVLPVTATSDAYGAWLRASVAP